MPHSDDVGVTGPAHSSSPEDDVDDLENEDSVAVIIQKFGTVGVDTGTNDPANDKNLNPDCEVPECDSKPDPLQEVVEEFRKIAEEGQKKAQFKLAVLYMNGTGIPKDEARAAEWYQKAAEQGHARAQCNLGVLYQEGRGVEQDAKKAAQLFLKAAGGEAGYQRPGGHARAQFFLGLAYSMGDGVTKDIKEAAKWYRAAGEQGNARAQCNLGVLYEHGHGVEQDDKKAAEWYAKAAAQQHVGAQCNLAILYASGRGVPQDIEKAETLRKEAMAARPIPVKTLPLKVKVTDTGLENFGERHLGTLNAF